MQISYNGLKFIKNEEGFRAEAYRDTGGVWTLGFGTIKVDGRPVEAGQTCTEQEAEAWLHSDLAWAQTAVNQLVKVPLKQHQFDALVSFVYNVGETAFRNSTMLKLLNGALYMDASKQFARWVFDNGKIITGLVKRRMRERALFEAQ